MSAPISAPGSDTSPVLRRPDRRTVLLAGAGSVGALLATGAVAAPRPAVLGEATGDRDLAEALRPHLGAMRTAALILVDGGATRFAGFGADEDREFEIGSVSKTFTGALVMDAVARGELTLDTTVAEILGDRATGSAIADVSIRELASHTSGIPSLPPPVALGARWRSVLRLDPYDAYDPQQVIDMALECTPVRRGTVAYSNHGVALEGQLVAEAAGTSWEALLSERLLAPLGLGATRAPLTAEALGEGAPTGHTENGHRARAWTMNGFAPAGGIRSTAADMGAYLRSMMDGSNPGAAGIEPTVMESETEGVGVNWFTSTRGSSTRAVFHNGQSGGFHAFCGWVPETGRGCVLLSDTADFAADEVALGILAGKVAS